MDRIPADRIAWVLAFRRPPLHASGALLRSGPPRLDFRCASCPLRGRALRVGKGALGATTPSRAASAYAWSPSRLIARTNGHSLVPFVGLVGDPGKVGIFWGTGATVRFLLARGTARRRLVGDTPTDRVWPRRVRGDVSRRHGVDGVRRHGPPLRSPRRVRHHARAAVGYWTTAFVLSVAPSRRSVT